MLPSVRHRSTTRPCQASPPSTGGAARRETVASGVMPTGAEMNRSGALASSAASRRPAGSPTVSSASSWSGPATPVTGCGGSGGPTSNSGGARSCPSAAGTQAWRCSPSAGRIARTVDRTTDTATMVMRFAEGTRGESRNGWLVALQDGVTPPPEVLGTGGGYQRDASESPETGPNGGESVLFGLRDAVFDG